MSFLIPAVGWACLATFTVSVGSVARFWLPVNRPAVWMTLVVGTDSLESSSKAAWTVLNENGPPGVNTTFEAVFTGTTVKDSKTQPIDGPIYTLTELGNSASWPAGAVISPVHVIAIPFFQLSLRQGQRSSP